MEIQLDLLNLMTGTGAPLLMQQDAEKKLKNHTKIMTASQHQP
jgi:hypothetical protein